MEKREKMLAEFKKAGARTRDLEEKWVDFTKNYLGLFFEPKHKEAFFSAHKGIENVKEAVTSWSVRYNLLGEIVNLAFTVKEPKTEGNLEEFILQDRAVRPQTGWSPEKEKKWIEDLKKSVLNLNSLENMSLQDIAELFSQDYSSQENILIQDIENTFEECLEIVKRKNKDYGETDEDPYKNFRNSESVGVSPEKAILVRISDKLSRISTLLSQDAEVKQESIEDTINDAINYFAILKSFLKNN